MCTKPYCLGTYWCSAWSCCQPPKVEMDDSVFEEPPAKKTTSHFASPVLLSKMSTICCYVPLNTKKATSRAVRTFEQVRDQQNEKSSKECLQICWKSPHQIALTAGCRILWWKLDVKIKNCTHLVAFQTYWLVFIATAKNANVTAQISLIERIVLSRN